jgi:hypothetical protein
MAQSEKKVEKIYYDSSIAFYCSGNIGYRWAVKVFHLLATEEVYGVTDTLFFQELLDRFAFSKDMLSGELLFKTTKRLMNEVIPVTKEDFKFSCMLFDKYPGISPRILLRVAVMLNNHLYRLCSTFAAGIETISEIERVNLIERCNLGETICR